MLEHIDLTKELPRKKYERDMPELQDRLHQLQRACHDARVSALMVFEGWDAAGKGTVIKKLAERLEPRAAEIIAVREPRTREKQLPWLARFWAMLPAYGSMAIFDRSWYGRVLADRVDGRTTEAEWRQGWRDIASFERALADDRYVILKFFLHISAEEQARRLRLLESDPTTAWQVERADWQRHDQYGTYLVAIEEMLHQTETEWGPWTIVEATDKNWVRDKVFRMVIERLERELRRRGEPVPGAGKRNGGGQ
jgi:polyphosphate kinase 2 (PPK2 family)